VDVLLVVVGCLTRCNVEVGILEIMPMEVKHMHENNSNCEIAFQPNIYRNYNIKIFINYGYNFLRL